MKIIVCIKQVPEAHCQIAPSEDGQSIVGKQQAIYWSISPEDECVVEQAVQISEQRPGSTVTAIRVGSKEKQEALVSALAMGVDKALLVTSDELLDPYRIAKALANTINRQSEDADLILCGNISYDNQNQQVPQLLAQMLDLPVITRVVDLKVNAQEMRISKQSANGSIDVFKVKDPILLACSYGIAEPRYAPLPHIKRAEKEVIEEMTIEEVGVGKNDQRLRYKNFRLASQRQQGKLFKITNDPFNEEVNNKNEILLNELADVLYNEAQKINK